MISNKKAGLIGSICICVLILMPLFTGKPPKGDISKGGIIRDEVLIQVTDTGKSDSGFVFCKFYIKAINKLYIGSCNTTNDTTLKVGGDYIATKFTIDKDTININKATLINTVAKLKVVRKYVVGRAVIAELSNGLRVGGENLNVDDEVYQ